MQLVLLISTVLSFIFSGVLAAPPPTCGLTPPQTTITTKPNNGGSSGSTSSNSSDEVVASAWVPGWSAIDLDSIPWHSYSHLTFAFAVTTNGAPYLSLNLVNTTLLTSFVARAQQEGVRPLVSVGGWTGSRYFSTNVQPSNQAGFVQAIVSMIKDYNLAGVEIDWEYPNHQGIGCNVISADDTANYLSFLTSLRKAVGQNATLNAAVTLTPFAGSDGNPSSDVSGFAQQLDWISLMNYDVWGSWSSTAGPNAPLHDSCAPVQGGSAQSAVAAWTAAKFPAKQIVLGVPSYAHSFSVSSSAAIVNNALALYPQFDKSHQPPGQGETNSTTGTDECGNSSGPSGIWEFNGLITAGFLQNSNGTVTAASGMYYTYDNCSQTPFVYNPTTQALVSFDNAESFAAKGKFINDNNLLGFAMYDVTGDTPQNTLINSISDAMGIEQYCN
ncbi:endochitinase [Amanita rubescens]|nr:endochitinase [Amanita rubescens]